MNRFLQLKLPRSRKKPQAVKHEVFCLVCNGRFTPAPGKDPICNDCFEDSIQAEKGFIATAAKWPIEITMLKMQRHE